MAKLINTTRRDIELPSRHIIARGASLTIPDEVAKSVDNWPRLNALILSGDVAAEFDPEAVDEVAPSAAVAIMSEAAVEVAAEAKDLTKAKKA